MGLAKLFETPAVSGPDLVMTQQANRFKSFPSTQFGEIGHNSTPGTFHQDPTPTTGPQIVRNHSESADIRCIYGQIR